MNQKCHALFLPVLLFVCAIAPAWAEEDDISYGNQPAAYAPVAEKKPERPKDPDGIITIAYENDIFAGEDNNYTNGVRIAYISPETGVPNWLEETAQALPFFPETGHSRWGFSIGQNMYTPNNISTNPPPGDDQPYAGWLYGTAAIITDNDDRLDTFQITVGMVGPASGAREVQGFIHELVDSPDPKGWDYQLKNEPGLVLTYQRKWRNLYEFSPFGFGVDFSPSVGANVGNIYTDASMGGVVRFGYDLPSDYGPPLIKPNLSGSDFFISNGRRLGWYVFGGVEGRAVGRNIFLDGNTFKDSPSVDKENFVGSAQAGVAVTYGDARLAYTQVFNTKEFETQLEPNTYGAVTLSVRF